MKRRTFISSLSGMAALAAFGMATPASALFGIDIGDSDSGSGSLDITSLWDAGENIARSFEDITPEQEYYIGRSVSAVILSKYPAYDNKSQTAYLSVLGNAVAQASCRPETFMGYSFQMLDTDEINALSAPGGFVFATRGLLRCCRTEDALAAVLAHEVGHVSLQHGLQQIQQSRLTSGLSTLAQSGAAMAGGDLAAVTEAFGGTIADVTTTMIESGYSRDLEYEADQAAVTTLQRLGYAPQALVDMLRVMQDRFKADSGGFARTHPSPKDRIKEIRNAIGDHADPAVPAPRAARFARIMTGV